MKQPVQPVTETNDGTLGKRREHPAFGCITISRPHGGHNALFGSQILHDHYISLQINTAVEFTDNGWIRHHSNRHLIEVHMTADQWARMVSSIGIGSGTPCTLHWSQGQGYYPSIPDPVIGDDHKVSLNEAGQKALQASKDLVSNIQMMIDTGKIGKKAGEALMAEASRASNIIQGTMPFILKNAVEHVEAVVTDAKSTVEAHLRQLVWDAGVDKLVADGALPVPQLENKQQKESPK